jgi:hypothetical protein
VASEDWDWEDARRCDFADVWAGVSVSVYVDDCAFYGVVVDCQGFIRVCFFACGSAGFLLGLGFFLVLDFFGLSLFWPFLDFLLVY